MSAGDGPAPQGFYLSKETSAKAHHNSFHCPLSQTLAQLPVQTLRRLPGATNAEYQQEAEKLLDNNFALG